MEFKYADVTPGEQPTAEQERHEVSSRLFHFMVGQNAEAQQLAVRATTAAERDWHKGERISMSVGYWDHHYRYLIAAAKAQDMRLYEQCMAFEDEVLENLGV